MKIGLCAVTMLTLIMVFSLATAEEKQENPHPWTDSAEFSLVMTGGNSEASTLGFKNLYQYKWTNALFTIKAGGIRAESTFFTRFATGTPGDYVITKEEDTRTTAENYYLNGKYERTISPKWFWLAGGGWDKNEFAGIKSRYSLYGGMGNIILDTERRKFRVDYSLQYTDETPVLEVAGYDGTYAAVRFSYNFMQKLFTASQFNQDFELIMNADETSDLRAGLMNALSTSMSQHLALKVGLDFVYDNEPAFQSIALLDPDTLLQTGTVPYQLDELDYIFTTSLVITF